MKVFIILLLLICIYIIYGELDLILDSDTKVIVSMNKQKEFTISIEEKPSLSVSDITDPTLGTWKYTWDRMYQIVSGENVMKPIENSEIDLRALKWTLSDVVFSDDNTKMVMNMTGVFKESHTHSKPLTNIFEENFLIKISFSFDSKARMLFFLVFYNDFGEKWNKEATYMVECAIIETINSNENIPNIEGIKPPVFHPENGYLIVNNKAVGLRRNEPRKEIKIKLFNQFDADYKTHFIGSIPKWDNGIILHEHFVVFPSGVQQVKTEIDGSIGNPIF